MKYILKYLCVGILLSVIVSASAAPEPSIVPESHEWTLNTIYSQPQQITVRIDGERKPQRFWYIILTVTNNTDRTVPFYPTCELMTDTFEIIPAYQDTRNAVFEKIKRRHKNRYPFLESLESADERILQGEDNTKDMVIIWPDFDPNANGISLFIAGLSNETAVVEIANPKEPDDIMKVYLRKTLQLQYSVSGDAKLRDKANLAFIGKRWIMR